MMQLSQDLAARTASPEEAPWLGHPWSVGWQGPGESVLYERTAVPGADQLRGARDRKALGALRRGPASG